MLVVHNAFQDVVVAVSVLPKRYDAADRATSRIRRKIL